jgi:hypothetical protein
LNALLKGQWSTNDDVALINSCFKHSLLNDGIEAPVLPHPITLKLTAILSTMTGGNGFELYIVSNNTALQLYTRLLVCKSDYGPAVLRTQISSQTTDDCHIKFGVKCDADAVVESVDLVLACRLKQTTEASTAVEHSKLEWRQLPLGRWGLQNNQTQQQQRIFEFAI